MNVTYSNMFHIYIYKIYNMIPLLYTKVNFIQNVCLEPGFITLKRTHDLYFELLIVLSIYRCPVCFYSCMLRGSVDHVSCLHINRNSLSYMQLTIYMQLCGTRYPMACTCSTFANQWRNVWFGIAVNDVIL